MNSVTVPLHLNFFDVIKLTKETSESQLPGLKGMMFAFDDYLKARIVHSYLESASETCTPLFFFEKKYYSLVCKSMDVNKFKILCEEANEIQKESADLMQILLDESCNIQ